MAEPTRYAIRAILAAMLLAAPAAAEATFAVILPDGREIAACAARYQPDARTFVFDPCAEVFSNGFE